MADRQTPAKRTLVGLTSIRSCRLIYSEADDQRRSLPAPRSGNGRNNWLCTVFTMPILFYGWQRFFRWLLIRTSIRYSLEISNGDSKISGIRPQLNGWARTSLTKSADASAILITTPTLYCRLRNLSSCRSENCAGDEVVQTTEYPTAMETRNPSRKDVKGGGTLNGPTKSNTRIPSRSKPRTHATNFQNVASAML